MKPAQWLDKITPAWAEAWVRAATREGAVAPGPGEPARRSTAQRLAARLARPGEALSPRALRAVHDLLRAAIDSRASEVEGGRHAQTVAQQYAQASPAERLDIALLVAEQFAPDMQRIEQARQALQAVLASEQAGPAEARLRRALQTPRRRLLQRFASFPDGLRFLIGLREEVLGWQADHPSLAALDGELEVLFSTWFDVGFLELRRLDWNSPASLLEKLILYEAVHDIRSWSDLKNRLDGDRRCYAFFHPRLPDEPLIFVEVAFTDRLADRIAELLDEAAPVLNPARASTAIFYSISSTQPGLKGVSFGDSLLKRVVEALQQEFPKLRRFATLSPIPGLRRWLRTAMPEHLAALPARRQQALRKAAAALLEHAGVEAPTVRGLDLPALMSRALDHVHTVAAEHPIAQHVRQLAAFYLTQGMSDGRPLDPVARFHLGNGASVERLHHAADLSARGLRQSCGLMVNYLYDLARLDRHRAVLAQGRVAASRQVLDLAKEKA